MRRVAIVLREQFCTIILGRESQFLLCLHLPRARPPTATPANGEGFIPARGSGDGRGGTRRRCRCPLSLSLAQQHRLRFTRACLICNLDLHRSSSSFSFFSFSLFPLPSSLPSDPHPARFLSSAQNAQITPLMSRSVVRQGGRPRRREGAKPNRLPVPSIQFCSFSFGTTFGDIRRACRRAGGRSAGTYCS